MTEVVNDASPSPEVAPGRLLRQAREAAGLHVVALAAMLKVPVRKLEALESGRFDELPDKTFVRTLTLSVCRQLKVDPTPILALLPQPDQVRLGDVASLNTPFRSPEATPGPKAPAAASVPRPVLFALVVLVLAGVVWFAVPARDPAAVRVTPVVPANGNTLAEDAPIAAVPPVQAAAAGNEPSVTTAPAEPGEVATPEAVTTAAATSTPAAPAPAAVASTGGGLLDIQATQVSWVEVLGASGNLLLQRELAAGETVSLSADAPFKVVVGRADATQVRVRGKVLDISGYARNNVARFEVR